MKTIFFTVTLTSLLVIVNTACSDDRINVDKCFDDIPCLLLEYNRIQSLNNKDTKEAIELLLKAEKLGDIKAKKLLLAIYADSTSPFFNYNEAVRRFKEDIQLNNYESATYLASLIITQNKTLSKKDFEEVKDLYILAANHNIQTAYYDLAAFLYDYKKYEEAFIYFNKAAEKYSITEAEFALGTYYQSGTPPVKIDYNKAIAWYSKAASKNDKNALHELGIIYLVGPKEFQDIKKGQNLLIKAYNLGNGASARLISEGYGFGWFGFSENKELAKIWLNRAIQLEKESNP